MRNETYRSIGGERGEVSPALRGSEQLSEWRGGEASLMRRKAKHRWCGEIEASLMRRNWSIANSEKSKCCRCSYRCDSFLSATVQVSLVRRNRSASDSEKSKHRRCSNRCDSFLSATVQVSSMRRNRSVADAQIVAICSYQRQFKCRRCGEIKASPMLRSLRFVLIDDGSSGLSATIQVLSTTN